MSNLSIWVSLSPPSSGNSSILSPTPPPPLYSPPPPVETQSPPPPQLESSPPPTPPPSNSTETYSNSASPPPDDSPPTSVPSNSPSNSSSLDASPPPISTNSSSVTPPPDLLVPPPPPPSPPPVSDTVEPLPSAPKVGGSSSNTTFSPTTPDAPAPPQAISSPQSPDAPAQTLPANPESPPVSVAPPTLVDSPAVADSPPVSTGSPTRPSNTEAHASATQTHVPRANHSSARSSSKSSSPGITLDSSNGSSTAAVGILLSMVVLALVALTFVVIRRKRKRKLEAFTNYGPPFHNFSGKSDGYYSRSGPQRGSSVHSGSYSGGPHSSILNSSGYGYNSGLIDASALGNSRSCFSYDDLIEITNGFSHENKIGEGGFGSVFRGQLLDGRQVAVKQLKAGSGQGDREFKAEVEIISRVHHRHLVSLVGYCIADQQRLLVYEFVPNGTLEYHLHGRGETVMEWTKRMKIAIGSAKGLAYLHEDCHPRIIHRDIKSANILLDNFFEAQVADFGLAKLSNDFNTHVSTRVMGTFGYMAPEYASSGKLTDRSDVFSFGVVLLELVTGRKPVDASQPLGDESLVEWARPLLLQAIETGDFQSLVDPKLADDYDKFEMRRMIETAAACVRHSATKRPRMVQVVRALDSEAEMVDLTNGVKFGQSTVFQSSQYPNSELQRFQQMAFASGEYSSEYGHSSDYSLKTSSRSKELENPEPSTTSWRSEGSLNSYQGCRDPETHGMNPRSGPGSLRYNFR